MELEFKQRLAMKMLFDTFVTTLGQIEDKDSKEYAERLGFLGGAIALVAESIFTDFDGFLEKAKSLVMVSNTDGHRANFYDALQDMISMEEVGPAPEEDQDKKILGNVFRGEGKA